MIFHYLLLLLRDCLCPLAHCGFFVIQIRLVYFVLLVFFCHNHANSKLAEEQKKKIIMIIIKKTKKSLSS